MALFHTYYLCFSVHSCSKAVGKMPFNTDLFENVHASKEASQTKVDPSENTNVSKATVATEGLNASMNEIPKSEGKKSSGRPGRPRTGKMERVMCYFPKELLEDMNHFSEKEMISRNSFIITCILKHIRVLKKEEREEE